jgi:hypothetical protein
MNKEETIRELESVLVIIENMVPLWFSFIAKEYEDEETERERGEVLIEGLSVFLGIGGKLSKIIEDQGFDTSDAKLEEALDRVYSASDDIKEKIDKALGVITKVEGLDAPDAEQARWN